MCPRCLYFTVDLNSSLVVLYAYAWQASVHGQTLLIDAVLCLLRVLVFLHFGRVFCIVVVVVIVFIIVVVVWPVLVITYLCFIDIVTYAFFDTCL